MASVHNKCCVYGSWLRVGPGKWPVSIISVVFMAAGYA
jgi:hypothetical protein